VSVARVRGRILPAIGDELPDKLNLPLRETTISALGWLPREIALPACSANVMVVLADGIVRVYDLTQRGSRESLVLRLFPFPCPIFVDGH